MKKLIVFLLLAGLASAQSLPFSFWKGAAGGGTFTPLSITSLVAWYDASTSGFSDGAGLNPLVDSKAGTYTLSASGLAPLFKSAQQNGLGTALFELSSSRNLRNGGSTASTFPYTIWAVIKATSLATDNCIMGSSASGGLEFRIDATTGYPTLNKAAVAAIGTGTTGIGTSAYHAVMVTVDSSSYAFYVDGVAAGSGSHSQTLTGSLTFQMGVFSAANDYLNGYIGEVGICSAVISGGDRASLTSYLRTKWGTP